MQSRGTSSEFWPNLLVHAQPWDQSKLMNLALPSVISPYTLQIKKKDGITAASVSAGDSVSITEVIQKQNLHCLPTWGENEVLEGTVQDQNVILEGLGWNKVLNTFFQFS